MVVFLAGDLLTGQVKIRNIPAKSGTSVAALSAEGSLACTVKLPLTDPVTGISVPFPATVQAGKSFLACVDRGVVHNAGPVTATTYNADTRELTLTASGLLTYFKDRWVLPVLNDSDPTDTPAGKSITFTTSLRTMLKQIVQNALAPSGAGLPVTFEADVAGTNTRTYTGDQPTTVADALKQISQDSGGPEFLFSPSLSADGTTLSWLLETGTPLTQAGADLVFDTSAALPSVTGISVARDASGLTTDDYEVGSSNGSAGSALTAKSHDGYLLGLGYPRRESSTSRSSVTNLSTLQSYADAAVATGEFYTDSWSFKTRKELAPTSDLLKPGYWAQIVTKGNPYLPDGRNRVRLLTTAIGLGDRYMTVTVAPERVHA